MKVPANCPICHDPLINEFDTLSNIIRSSKKLSRKHLTKFCRRRLSHKYYCVLGSDENIFLIQIMTTFGMFFWNFETKTLSIVSSNDKGGQTSTRLPWFEPEINDGKKFLNKLKTYVTFS